MTKISYSSDFKNVFLGYSPSHKGYKCLAAGGRLFISKDVTFNERVFPYPPLFPEPALLTSEVPDTASTLTVLPSAVSVHPTNTTFVLHLSLSLNCKN